MPLIQCHLGKRLPADARRTLIADLVDATSRTLGADPRTITVILHEHDPSNLRELDFVPRSAQAPPGPRA